MHTDIAIVGGGPGGTATAIGMIQRGYSTLIIEKDEFPRFHIGESLTGECGNCLRQLGLEERMTDERYPIKRGVTVYGPGGKNEFWIPVMGRCPEKGLFAADTWQVRRSTFDAIMVDKCRAMGVNTLRASAQNVIRNDDGDICGVQVMMPDGKLMDIHCRVLVDASGLNTFLSRVGVLSEKHRGSYDKQVGIFSHFKNVIRDQGDKLESTIIYYREKHHWAWYIPIDDEVVSIGVVVPSDYYKKCGESKEEFLRREVKQINAKLAERLPTVDLCEEVRAISNYSYHIQQFTGRNYLCIGDSHRFIDPVFSFGLYFAVKESAKACEEMDRFMRGETRNQANPFLAYQEYSERGQSRVQDLIDAFWNHPYAFAVFAHARYREDFIDLFAGRIYGETESPGYQAMRNINKMSREGREVVSA